MSDIDKLNLPLKCDYDNETFGGDGFREWHFIEDADGNALDDENSISAIVEIVNSHAQLKTDLDRAINAGAAHADRADELYAENLELRKALNNIIDSASEEVVWLGGSAVTVDFNALNDAEELLTKLEKGE